MLIPSGRKTPAAFKDLDDRMITIFRDFTKTIIFKVLMGLLAVSFAFFGMQRINDVFNINVDSVVTAGKRSVSRAEFKAIVDSQKAQMAQQNNGQVPTNEELVQAGEHTAMLERLATQESMFASLEKQGLVASDRSVVERLSQIPVFISPVTGRFDKNLYAQVLNQHQVNRLQFEKDQRDEILQQQFLTAAGAGLKAPRIYSLAAAAVGGQTRDFSYTAVGGDINSVPMPSEAEVAALYKSQLDRNTVPETRVAKVVILSTKQFADQVQVSDDELHKAYEQRLPTLKVAETRSFVAIRAKDDASAKAIAAALKQGQSPDVVAKANNSTVAAYDNKTREGVADDKLADAAFRLQTGDVSGPVQTDLGLFVVRMGDIHVGSTPSFESVKPQIKAELSADRAKDQLNKVSHQLADALNAGQDFDATLQKLGLKATTLPDMTKDGAVLTQQGWEPRFQKDYSQLVKAIYSLQPGAVSEVEEFGADQYFAVKLLSVKPAAAPPLAAMHDMLVQQLRLEKLQTTLGDQAQKVVDRLNAGEPLAKVAAEMKLPPVKTEANIDRTKAQQMRQLGGRVFSAKPGEAFQVQVQANIFLVGRLDAIHQPDINLINTQAAMIRPQLAQSFASDLSSLAEKAARDEIKPKTYPKTAAQALGVSPSDTKDGDTPKKP
jgi:peptidyl-prolyl cis-trans isomerase D